MKFVLAVLMTTLLSACAVSPPVPPPPPAPMDPPGEKEFADGAAWLITDPLHWEIGSSGVSIVVPTGFVHDKASIPQALWTILPKNGRYTRAAVVHDYLYWTQQCTREQADNLLMIAMKESDVGWLTRRAVYRGVRVGGGAAWQNNRTERLRGEPRFSLHAYPQGNMDWPELRARLGRFSDPPIDPRKDYCVYGNSQDVPNSRRKPTRSR